MNDWSKVPSTHRPLDMVEVQNSSMALATARTIDLLIEEGELSQRDMATARLAQEDAERIDKDGEGCGITLYNRLYSLLLDLKHEGRAFKCPLASVTTAKGQEDTGCTL